jgi:branched-chain amino acid transport system ATP-binding protein
MRLCEGEGVTKYFGGLAAVVNVEFHIDQGEIVGLIGPNGAGKTTFFNLISGALAPTSGVIRFKGENIAGLRPYQICRRKVARTFQSVKIFPGLTVFENVELGALFGSSGPRRKVEAEAEAMEQLEFVGLSAKKNMLARDLTVANQKRVEVARALSTRPELLMLDELVAGLNPTEVGQIIELTKRIRDKGITVIMIEHVMKVIMNISDRIMVLHHGEKIAEGTPGEVASSKRVIEVYLGKQADAKG